MQEIWTHLDAFPGYAVSNFGNVVNLRRDIMLKPTRTAHGLAKVGLVYRGMQFTRSVARLVATLYLPNDRDPEIFDTPINLDGDRMNCRVDNLKWRPRWHAIKYHQQFEREEFHFRMVRLEDLDSHEQFVNLKDPCVRYGLYHIDVILSYVNGTPVFPTGQVFHKIEN